MSGDQLHEPGTRRAFAFNTRHHEANPYHLTTLHTNSRDGDSTNSLTPSNRALLLSILYVGGKHLGQESSLICASSRRLLHAAHRNRTAGQSRQPALRPPH